MSFGWLRPADSSGGDCLPELRAFAWMMPESQSSDFDALCGITWRSSTP
jgi:hypothetical protein